MSLIRCKYCGLRKPIDVNPWDRCSRCGKNIKVENEAEKRAHLEDEMRVEFEDELPDLIDM